MADDQGIGIFTTAFFMNEMYIDFINSCGKMIEAIDRILLFKLLKILNPIGAEFTHVIEIDPVLPASVIRHFMPGKSGDPFFDFGNRLFWNIKGERMWWGHCNDSIRLNRLHPRVSMTMTDKKSDANTWKARLVSRSKSNF